MENRNCGWNYQLKNQYISLYYLFPTRGEFFLLGILVRSSDSKMNPPTLLKCQTFRVISRCLEEDFPRFLLIKIRLALRFHEDPLVAIDHHHENNNQNHAPRTRHKKSCQPGFPMVSWWGWHTRLWAIPCCETCLFEFSGLREKT